MKKLALIIAIAMLSMISFAQVNSNHTYVKGYYKSNGTYVQGHYRTKPNYTNKDNYSTKPNVNHWTGKKGTVKPDKNYYYGSKTYSSSKKSTGSYYKYGTKPKKTKTNSYYSW